jgi:hypothetical protein
MRIAMWSGPRNLSTAMMYSFGARADCEALDEPFYAAYLKATGLEHPMRDEVLAAQEQDPQKVPDRFVQDGTRHLYMKHMAQHMIDGFPLEWAEDCVNIHLIRHPARVIASYNAKREAPTLADVGFAQQVTLFERLGGLIIDSADIRANPEAMLRKLCAAIDLPFDPAMLCWTAGPRAEDGVWAPHWYGSIHKTTGFAGPEGPLPEVDALNSEVLDAAMPYYERLRGLRLKE